jgi:hypothetical protein
MAVKFEFVSAFICERVLREEGGITSAIRIVDIFFVPEDAPEYFAVSFWVVISLKTMPVPDVEVNVGTSLIRTSGERERLAEPTAYRLLSYNNDPSIPGGFNLLMQLTVKPKNMGTCYVEVDIDGEALVRVPFTLRRPIQTEPNPKN